MEKEKVLIRRMDCEDDSDEVTQIQNHLDRMLQDLIEIVRCAKRGDAEEAKRAAKRVCEASFRADDLADSVKISKDGTIDELERKNKNVIKRLEAACKEAENLHVISQKKLTEHANRMMPRSDN